MFRLYFITGLRRLSKEKMYVTINVLSLALGIASFLILSLYLRSELTYDQHHSKHERIYRIVSNYSTTGGYAQSSEGIGPLLTQDYPQLGEYVRIRPATQNNLSCEDKNFSWEDF